jgi:hypothetical protein
MNPDDDGEPPIIWLFVLMLALFSCLIATIVLKLRLGV